MQEERSVQAEPLPIREHFRMLANDHKADVRRIREAHRQTRLRYVLYLNLAVLAYLLDRVFTNRPVTFGPPHISSDFFLIGLLLILAVAIIAMVAMPLLNGRSPHVRFSAEEIGLGFADVRGIDVVLEEVARTLQIFLTYKTFKDELGGNPRRGVLFEGRPGTGKTHMAKAMAAEAGVPFFFVSAPAFQSMWFGMTAMKIRAYFKALKKAARKEGGAIGFIEEIDAVGGSRGIESAAPYTGERKSVSAIASQGSGGMVNELLIQLQSFDTPPVTRRIMNGTIDVLNKFLPNDHQLKKKKGDYSNVLIIGATNRADSLDAALLRPGRFDRSLYFDVPSRAGRRDLIDYFLAARAIHPEMLGEGLREEFASMTLGYTPAMLEHVLDEALVWAIRDGRRQLSWRDVQQARLSEEIGLAQPVAYTARERQLIATHEAGHATAAYLCGKDRKLEVLSIIKRRDALGLLAHSSTEERFTMTQSELESTIKISLGGMAAEQLFFGETGTGPSSDLSAATSVAAQMVGSFGMGRSLISYDAVDNGTYMSPNIVAKVLGNDSAREEVEGLLRSQREEITALLGENLDLVEALRDALQEREELMGDEILRVLETATRKRGPVVLDPAEEIVLG
ncbi:MAG: cell division protease FtsH [Actinomycetota bacterium]|nr:cell division protease FtsH [Actinomycetota bacterium]